MRSSRVTQSNGAVVQKSAVRKLKNLVAPSENVVVTEASDKVFEVKVLICWVKKKYHEAFRDFHYLRIRE